MFVALLFAYNFAAGERMQVNDGLGWDGFQYAQFTWTPTRELLFKWPSYYVGRFLPPIAIHNIAQLLNIDISTPRRMIAAYYVVNTMVLCLAFLMLLRISKLTGWSPPATLVAVASIFFNYGVLKQVNYGPMSTDIMALGCAVATLYAWVGQSFYSLIVVTIVSAFVWPSLLYLQLPLLVFWNVSGIALDAPPPRFPWGRVAAAVVAVGTVVVALLLYLFTAGSPSGPIPSTPTCCGCRRRCSPASSTLGSIASRTRFTICAPYASSAGKTSSSRSPSMSGSS